MRGDFSVDGASTAAAAAAAAASTLDTRVCLQAVKRPPEQEPAPEGPV